MGGEMSLGVGSLSHTAGNDYSGDSLSHTAGHDSDRLSHTAGHDSDRLSHTAGHDYSGDSLSHTAGHDGDSEGEVVDQVRIVKKVSRDQTKRLTRSRELETSSSSSSWSEGEWRASPSRMRRLRNMAAAFNIIKESD